MNLSIYLYSTGQESDSILHWLNLAKSCVFVKQSPLSAFCDKIFHYETLYTLYTEVEESFCRVPLALLSQSL